VVCFALRAYLGRMITRSSRKPGLVGRPLPGMARARAAGTGSQWGSRARAGGAVVGMCAVLLGGLPGCVLPIPHQSVERRGLGGRVIDGRTEAPVAGATVRLHYPSPDSGSMVEAVTTDSQGLFAVPTTHELHWGVFVGVAGNHSLPKRRWLIVPEPLKLEVEHSGYLPLRQEFRPSFMGPAAGAGEESARPAVSGNVYRLTPRD